jgi:hypothetical protein
VELARKNFAKPVEILASKPSYSGWTQPGGEKEPAHFETTFIGHHFQLGSLPNGHLDPPGMNLNGFRLLAENSRRGADTLILFTSLDYNHSHASATAGGDQLAQLRGNLIWLNAKPDTKFYLTVPKSAGTVADGPIVFFRLEKTWLALHLVNTRAIGLDAGATAKVCGSGKKDGREKFPDDQVWSASGTGDGVCGMVFEVGEPETHGDFAAFRAMVKARSKLAFIETNGVDFTSANGDRLGLRVVKEGRPTIVRQGVEHDWKKHWNLWTGADGGTSPVTLDWKGGVLRVEAGGRKFRGTLKDGRYDYENR